MNHALVPGGEGEKILGETHLYIFTLFALDSILDLAPGANYDTAKAAMDGHRLSCAVIIPGSRGGNSINDPCLPGKAKCGPVNFCMGSCSQNIGYP